MVRNTDLAADKSVRRDYAVLAAGLLSGACGQLRNKATTAGNLLQRTRCPYFYDTTKPCNKRKPGSGCAAIGGFSRNLAILGSQRCLHRDPPSRHGGGDAACSTRGRDGRRRRRQRRIPIADFHRLPGDTPHIETSLAAWRTDHRGYLAQAARRHACLSQGARPRLLCLRNVSVAAVEQRRPGASLLAGSRTSRGGSKPAEQETKPGAIADAVLAGARTTSHNAYKPILVGRTLAAVIREARA